jgi:hypothetical protein
MIGKTESVIIAVFLFIAFPFTFFVLAWWGSLMLSTPEKAIPVCAFAGLGVGIAVVISGLRTWLSRFYSAGKILTVPLYLFWSAIALAFFMGLPIGVVTLGLLAGFYAGRKGYHAGMTTNGFKKYVLKVCVFTSIVTGFVSLAMGILAVQDARTMQHILMLVGMSSLGATASGRAVLVVIAVPVLIGVQYWLTSRMAWWGFGFGRKKA